MAVPYDCDALLPVEQRFTSTKYRRLSRRVEPQHLTWAEAVELVAWMQFLGGPKYAKGVMQWATKTMDYVQILYEAPELIEEAAPLLAANQAQVTIEDGFRLLSAIKDSPKRRAAVPELVRMALNEERHNLKLTAKQQAEKHGLTVDQITYRRKKPGVVGDDRRLIGLAFA